jgi:Histidine kinase-like ATPase domain
MDANLNSENLGVVSLLRNAHFRFQHPKELTLVAEFLANLCPHPRLAIVGLTEIFFNAIEHGNLGISSAEKEKLQKDNIWLEEIERRLRLPQHRHQYVNVQFTRTDTEIQLIVKDDGVGFDWKNSEKQAISTHGRGILIAKEAVFQSLQYSPKGNEVACIISLL